MIRQGAAIASVRFFATSSIPPPTAALLSLADTIIMPSQDPESYSVEEMMQRLKGRQAVEIEQLVIRADGTRMIKKRHRKRRSAQSKAPRSSQSMRFMKVAIILALTVSILLGGFGLLAYHNSSVFIAKTEAKVGSLSGAGVKITGFGFSPVRAQARAVELKWPDAGFLRSGRFDHITAKVHPLGFVGGGWRGEDLIAREGRIFFGAPQGAMAPVAKDDKGYGFMRYRCANFTAEMGGDPASRLLIAGAEATFYLRKDANQLRLTGGLLSAPGWGRVALGRSHFWLKNDELTVALQGRNELDGKGEISISGKVNPFSRAAGLNVNAVGFPLVGLVGANFGQLIDGRVDSDAMATFNPADFSSLEVAANFAVSAPEVVRMSRLPIFAQLEREFNNAAFASPVFQSAQGLISRSAVETRLSGLRFENRNVLIITGSMAMDAAGNLTGSLEIGVGERLAVLITSPELGAGLSLRRDGYHWGSITLGGTAAAPTTRFTTVAAAPSTPPRPAAESAEEMLEREFNQLTR